MRRQIYLISASLILLMGMLSLSITMAQSGQIIFIDSVKQHEGNSGTTDFIFTVERTGDPIGTIEVDYATEDVSATAGSDYISKTGTLTFADGETQKNITIQVNGDTDEEPDEMFRIQLTNPRHATETISLGNAIGTGIIYNDDNPSGTGNISIYPLSVNIAEGGATADVHFSLLSDPVDDVTIQLSPNAQCTASQTTVTLTSTNWNSGVDVTVTAVDDNKVENLHTCVITLSNSTSANALYDDIDLPNITANITDNDQGQVSQSATPTPININQITPTPLIPYTPSPVPPTSTPAPTATSAVPSVARVSEEVRGLALRTGPYLGATLMGSALIGTDYPILARSHDEGGMYPWYLIQVGETRGWASGRYLHFIGFADLLPIQGSIFDQLDDAPDIGVYGTTLSLNDLRVRPSGRAAIITQIPAGAQVSIVGRTRQNSGDFWYQVRYNGQLGWIPAFIDHGDTSQVPIR